MKKLDFVFTNFNNSKYTKDAIESIQVFNKGQIRIIVVDNNSETDDVQALKVLEQTHKNVNVIYNEKNVGYFKGLNIGLKYLRKNYNTFDFVVIGNNDLLFPLDFYDSILKKRILFDKYPIISPSITTLDGVNQNPHVIKEISKLREFVLDVYHTNYFLSKLILWTAKNTHFLTGRRDQEQHPVAQEIYRGYGACYILGNLFFKNFKNLWAPTFLLYEEYFLSKQLSDKNFKIFYEPSINVIHLMHATTKMLVGKVKWQFSREAHKEYRKHTKTFY